MAKFIDISELEEKMPQTNYDMQVSFDNHTDRSMVTDKMQQDNKALNTPDEELAVLLQEKMQLDEMGKELQKIVINKREENVDIIEKREKQEKALENEILIANLVQSILSKVYHLCELFKSHIEGALDSKRNELRNVRMLCENDKAAVEQTLSKAESMFSSFKEQVSTIEFLMKPKYDILYHEDENCFNVVINEFNKLKDCYNNLLSMLFNV